MNFNSKYHPVSFIPKMIMGKIGFVVSGTAYGKGDLLVLNYHSTPEWLLKEFRNQLDFLSSHFRFLSPSEIPDYFTGKLSFDPPGVIFTFDDGLKNNLGAAALLEEYHTRGLFFIVPEFYRLPVDQQESYYEKNIRYEINRYINTQSADVTAMNRIELEGLLKAGHVLGSHSFTHTMKISDSHEKRIHEIVDSKRFIEEMFGIKVEHFCAPFDSMISTDKDYMKLIRAHYSYYHSTLPGSNMTNPDPYFIRRTNVECFWPLDVMKYAISNLEWSRYRERSELFNKETVLPSRKGNL